MLLLFKRNYLDFKSGEQYEVVSESSAKYMINMSIAKEVVGKDGKPTAKVDETKVDETKVDETKVDETKVDETKVDETKVDETKVDETKVDETKVEKKGILNILGF